MFEYVSLDTFAEQLASNSRLGESEIAIIYHNIKLPKRATQFSAGYDFFSPVSITIFFIPYCFKFLIVSFASSFILSDIKIYPEYFLSITTYTTVPISLLFVKSIPLFSNNG